MTDSTKLKLLVAIRHMGQNVVMTDFNSRLAFQKKVYLLQELGLRLGNTYGWYIHGPYSRDVASDGFQLALMQSNYQDDELEPLSEEELAAVANYQSLVQAAIETLPNRDEVYCLELLASLHFTLHRGYPRPQNTAAGLERFIQSKPKFTEDAATALELLERFALA
jgi:hypothetical protein